MDVARITQGRITLRKDSVPLGEIVGRAVESVRERFEDRALVISISLPPGDLEVEGDEARLEQVIGNLLANAAKYTEPGGRISVSLATKATTRSSASTTPASAYPPTMLPRVFDLFIQADADVGPHPRRAGHRPHHSERPGRHARRTDHRAERRRQRHRV